MSVHSEEFLPEGLILCYSNICLEIWTTKDKQNLILGFKLYGKDFKKISTVVKTKTIGQIIGYYYCNKTIHYFPQKSTRHDDVSFRVLHGEAKQDLQQQQSLSVPSRVLVPPVYRPLPSHSSRTYQILSQMDKKELDNIYNELFHDDLDVQEDEDRAFIALSDSGSESDLNDFQFNSIDNFTSFDKLNQKFSKHKDDAQKLESFMNKL